MLEELSYNEMIEVDGGLVITGMMVATGIGCLSGGVAVGYAVGKVIRRYISKSK